MWSRRTGLISGWVRAAASAGLVVAIVLSVSPATARQVSPTIQPGAGIELSGGANCTLNWVFDEVSKKARVFVGTAAHCTTKVGEVVSLSTGPYTGVATEAFGKVAFISKTLDYALIRVDADKLNWVDPSMKGHPDIPTGVSTEETAREGDHIQFSGYGTGFHLTEQTQESRFGILHFFEDSSWSAAGPANLGDSGGPAADVTDGGKALGVLTQLCSGGDCNGVGGVTVVALLEDARQAGLRVRLRNVR